MSKSVEKLPLLVSPPRRYGSVFPYYEFLRSRVQQEQQTLHRSESMVSLCFRTLSGFINDDNLPGLKQLLESKQVQVDDRDENGSTALILAATKGRSAFVRELLAHGADANAEDSDSWTALLCAAKEGHADIVLQLLEHNADIEHRDMGNWTALMWATYKGRVDVVQLLLDKGAEVNAHGNYHISSLIWSAGRGFTQITEALIAHGAKVNVGDKYGTTALVWASRKGHAEIAAMLLKAGANVDTAGMYSWTALLMATQGNHVEVVNLLLDYKPNVNALDKDGCSALTIACKEGNNEIVTALMAAGAYINVQDRFGDTNLIHAVKGGHRSCVESLLKKYADVDIAGKDQKTAIYMAVEKGNASIVKLLLGANPDLEMATKDGDTPLLKAVRSRNAEIVQLLLDKKAKVSAADKKGDTALHIAMRARSKGIVEILLRNPKHSQLLYRPNRAGETPYNIDINHQKTILGQIFGARRLNTNEDNENMLGYDLYSSALADILSEPSLSMPITVGLYAKWGSGKSFLLNKLRDEMKNFAREWVDPVFQFTSLMFLVLLHVALIVGTIVGLSVQNWIVGLSVAVAFLSISYIFLALVWFANKRYDWDWPYNFNVKLTRKLNNIKLVLQVLFCHPPGAPIYDGVSAHPIRFYFTDQTRVSSTAGGENSVVQMIGSLYDAIESDYGALATRLFRAFKPKPVKSSSTWKLRKLCCLPYVVIFEIIFLCVLVGTCALTVYLVHVNSPDDNLDVIRVTLQIILGTDALLLSVATVANVYTWSRLIKSVLFSQRRHLQRTIAKLEILKSEGFLQALRQEVNLMKDMVKCLDSLSSQQTRLVIIVDGLDSCEQDKVLLILDTVHMLFSDANSPFIVILAIDPHVIAKAVEMNTRRLFSESNIGGHNYLSNMVHLPFYLQNSGLRKVKLAQQTAQAHRKSALAWTENEETLGNFLARSSSSRRLSNESALMSSQEKLKPPGRKNSRKLKMSESVASSIGSNLNKIGGAQDLTKMLLTDDYFSDVNPRSMRRLMNVVYITGRLLKAFQIDFNWYRLASWINITEQWPFRTSWIIYHYELYEDSLEDNTSLKLIFDKIRPHIPTVKDTEPLLELDRDEKKFDIFLTFHRSSLLVSDLKIFLPFTINLDPYLKKVIKEETQSLDDDGLLMTTPRNISVVPTMPWTNTTNPEWASPRPGLSRRNRNAASKTMYQPPTLVGWPNWNEAPVQVTNPQMVPLAPVTSLAPEVFEKRLSSLSVDGVCKLLYKIEEINSAALPEYSKVIKEHNITGKVLLHCDLDELKKLLKMSFGDWEMFKVMLISLREHEVSAVFRQEETPIRAPKPERKTSTSKSAPPEKETKELNQRKQSVMEKQVTLEEQMICGALQTLNEEACEDVLEETEEKETKITIEPDVPQTSVIPPSPDSNQDYPRGYRSRTNSSSGVGETEFVLLQSSPIGHMHWQPISISVGGTSESLSEHSSRCSSQLPSPVAERRLSNGIKLSNLKPTNQIDDLSKKGRHVVIKTECGDSSHISVMYNASETKTPLLQEFNSQRPTTLHLLKNEKASKPLMRNRSKSIDSQKKKNDKNFEKLQRLKEKLLHSSPELNENASDNESTPLVSEVSTPSKSGQSSELKSSNSNSFPLSPTSQKSLSPEFKHRQTRSEQNLTDTTDVSPVLSFPESIYLSNIAPSSGGNSLSPKAPTLTRTVSECTSISGMISSCSNVSLPSSKNSHSSGQLSRQNALDFEEILADCYCDPSRGG
ncbi:kinase D-interacting substrate of 220 kDa B isoform X3 [Zophobas morio]|uniref:kinase D-interacting substrate of 220 kDa B isoform X3 n=1 Tax=Zophobas morio TaxID=2755281 RepID=UPI0030838EA2